MSIRKFISVIVLTLGVAASLAADEARSKLPRYNYHYTREDSLALSKINARMDTLRSTYGRPTVGLVLSGGGAKGFAYVGAIKYLEEKGVPVDLVVGTSIGGLMGGLYAMGYPMAELEEVLPQLGWMAIMTDKVARNTLSFAQKDYIDTYNISMPFYSAPSLSAKQEETDLRRILGSLPAGYSHGYNVMNLFSALSVGYEDDIDFFDMEVPYATVALDVMTNHLKVFHEGNIKTAMRSTMSIPGIFTPMKIGDKVLVDGGFMDNFPLSLAKDMGADYIIALDVSSQTVTTAKDVENLVDVLMAYMNSVDREAYHKNRALADFYCNPDVYEYDMLSFNDEAIEDLIQIGYEAMESQEAELDSLMNIISGPINPRTKRAVNLFRTPIHVGEIQLRGISDRDLKEVQKRIGYTEILQYLDEPLSKYEIDKIIAKLVSLDTFETVNYSIQGDHEPYTLVIDCVQGPIHHLGASVRFDTEEVVSAGLHIGLNYHRLTGHKFDLYTKVSMNPSAQVKYSYDFANFPTINLSGSLRYTNADVLANNNNLLSFTYTGASAKLYLSDINLSVFDFKAGVKDTSYWIRKYLSSTSNINQIPTRVSVFAPFAELYYNTTDDKYFPHEGMVASMKYDWSIPTYGYEENYHTVYLELRKVYQLRDRLALIPSFYSRFQMGAAPVTLDMNIVGGNIAGRYVPQQIPFMGINTVVAHDRLLSVAGIQARYQPFKDVYFSAVTNYARSASSFKNFGQSTADLWGVGVEAAYDSLFGPAVFNIHWNSYDKRVGIYLGIGYTF